LAVAIKHHATDRPGYSPAAKRTAFEAVPFAGPNEFKQAPERLTDKLRHNELYQVLLGYLNSGAALS
jgi:hypothetical protein